LVLKTKSVLYLGVTIIKLSIVPEVDTLENTIHFIPPDVVGHQLVLAVWLLLPEHPSGGNGVV
jgi:hypothetical protein